MLHRNQLGQARLQFVPSQVCSFRLVQRPVVDNAQDTGKTFQPFQPSQMIAVSFDVMGVYAAKRAKYQDDVQRHPESS